MILSLVVIVVLGLLSNRLFTWLKLPGLLGMILVGVAVGPYGLNWLEAPILENAADVRLIALIVILLRAGLGLEKQLLKSVGSVALKMSALPCLMEGFTVMAVSRLLLGLPWAEAGMLGFIVAAVSPAVIVPAMLQLKEQGWGMQRGIPIIVLAGASVDDVFAITLFTAFLGIGTQAGGSLLGQVARIPLEIVGGVLLGGFVGWALAILFQRVKVSHLESVGITIAGAFATLVVGQQLHLAGLLGVMTMGLLLLEKAPGRSARLEQTLNVVWFFAQIFLFVLIGAEVDVALAWQAGLAGLGIIAAGLLARTAGVMLALAGSALTRKERIFTAIAYLPKATVQAAIGGIPLAMGVGSGGVILAIAVLAVVLTASLGAIAIKATAPHLLEREPVARQEPVAGTAD
jgi:solute carrier family 9B (sodium/hydrogen exchanger), member 1/2